MNSPWSAAAGNAELPLSSTRFRDPAQQAPGNRAVKPKARETEQPTWTPEEVADFLGYVLDDDPDWHALFATIAVPGSDAARPSARPGPPPT
jgi:hypothetical protein